MESLHAGTPSSDFECWEHKTAYFHNFLDLPDTKGADNFVLSPKFKCFGHTWGITVYPGGHRKAKNGWVSVSINNLSDEKITIDYDIAVLYADDKVLCMKRAKKRVFDSADTNSWGWKNFVSRATLVEKQSKYLDNGALKIQVMMRLSGGCYHNRIRQHVPDNNYLGVKGDDETSDVAFDLQGEIMVAHKCIIKSNAKDFYVMCEGYSKSSPMIIADVDKVIFGILIRSLYGGGVFPEEWQKHSEPILEAASKYGFDTLKSEAEVWYSKSLKFTVDNVIERFMEADGKNYTLVKLAAKKFIIEHGKKVVASESFNNLCESKELMREMMAAAFDNNKKRKRESGQES